MSFMIINADALREAREARGWSQTMLARKINCTQQFVSLLETGGQDTCPEDRALYVCELLKIEPSQVFGRFTVTRTAEPI